MDQLEDKARLLRNEYQRNHRTKNKEKANAYMRAWRTANKEKVKEYDKKYWIKKAMQQQSLDIKK